MKKILIPLLGILFSFSSLLHAFEPDNIKTFTLENGLVLYFMEDSSCPTVRIELSIDAGYGAQDEKNAGYFSLYANLIKARISKDKVTVTKTVTPLEFEKTISEFTDYLKPLRISDNDLKTAFNQAKKDVQENAASASGFINSAIETRLFPQSPWKNESGIYPQMFSSKTISEVRSTLLSIGDNFYTSDKTKFFISGNLTETTALSIVQEYFGRFKASGRDRMKSNFEKKVEAALKDTNSKERKFVLYDKAFSDEMTQIVVEYKNFSHEESDILANVFNEDDSPFKKLLLKQRNLRILGGEYIDVSASLEKESSRLIMQSLLGNAKVSPVIQADLFLTMSRDSENLSDDQISSAVKIQRTNFSRLKESSPQLMEEFSKFTIHSNEERISEAFFEWQDKLSGISAEELNSKLQEETPFVFVLVNSAVYAKYAKEFKNAGFVAINSKNGAWFNQKFYQDLMKQKENRSTAKNSGDFKSDISNSADRFIEKHKSEFSGFELTNGIPVVIKKNPDAKSALLSLTIAGGDLLFAKKTPGLTAILTDSIAINIQNQLKLFAEQGSMNGYYQVSAQTFSTHSIINVLCQNNELNFAVQAAYTALIFCDVSPAVADGVTYDERTKWRLKTGTPDFQLLCEAMRILYKDTDFPQLYKDSQDKPNDMSFTKILEGYPVLLDASRFSLIAAGGIDDEEKMKENLEQTFGTLISQKETKILNLEIPRPKFKKLSKKVQIKHLFLTDISKDKAGPMPAKLIPTTKFLDPVLYCIPVPDMASTDCALFNALLLELGSRIEERISAVNPQSKVKVGLPDPDMPFARIVVTNVERTSDSDRIYEASVASIKNDLKYLLSIKSEDIIDIEKNDLLSRLESNWILTVLSEAGSLEGTASLIESGIILKNPQLYLEQYKAIDSARIEDYFLIAESLLDEKAPMILYSKDSK